MPDIFLNADLGSTLTPAQIAEILPHVHMANVSSLNADSIKYCAQLAENRKPFAVSTGALICAPENCVNLSLEAFKHLLEIQLIRYTGIADLNHIKLDSALLALVENDVLFCETFLDFVRNNCLISILCPFGSNLINAAAERRLPIAIDLTLDREYSASGQPLPEVITHSDQIVDRLKQLHHTGEITALDGTSLTVPTHDDHITISLVTPSPQSLTAMKSFLNSL